MHHIATLLDMALTVALCMVILEMCQCIFVEMNSRKCRNGGMCKFNLEDFYLLRCNTL
jgi:hypothetical protein